MGNTAARIITFSLAGILISAVPFSLAAPPFMPLTDPNNRHNLSSNASHSIKAADPGLDGTDEICVFCHTPHSASAQSALWNRPMPAGPFPLYGNPLVIKGDFGGNGQSNSQYGVDYPNGASKMCLSCHDGVTAIGEVLNPPKDLAMIQVIGTLSGVDLATSHPISFVYNNAVLGDILAAKPTEVYQLPTLPGIRLDAEDRMQCTTCHDPHDDTETNVSIRLPFWRHKTAADWIAAYDEVCATCHVTSTTAPGHGL